MIISNKPEISLQNDWVIKSIKILLFMIILQIILFSGYFSILSQYLLIVLLFIIVELYMPTILINVYNKN